MELKQMRYFQAVAEELNFNRAARRLHIAQPPLTRHIRAIEQDLGVALFIRTPKGVELTEAGRALLAEVPNLLALAQRAREQTQRAGKGLMGRIDVGVFSSGILEVIPQLLAGFVKERPGIQINLHNLPKMEQIEALRERRILVGFNRLVPPVDDIALETVLEEPFLVALYEGHRLCARRAIGLRDLAGEPMILYPNAPVHGLAEEVSGAFAKERVPLVVAQDVQDVITAIALVASRFGVCVTTASTASLRLPGVVYRPLRCRHLHRIALNCLYLRDNPSPVLAAFLAIVRRFRQARNGV